MSMTQIIKAYGIVDSSGELMSDFIGRIGFTTLSKAKSVAKEWRGKVVKLEIKVIEQS